MAVQHVDDAHATKNFTFKCHRDGNDVYPVNSMAFHPQYGTFCSAGSDGTFNFWVCLQIAVRPLLQIEVLFEGPAGLTAATCLHVASLVLFRGGSKAAWPGWCSST